MFINITVLLAAICSPYMGQKAIKCKKDVIACAKKKAINDENKQISFLREQDPQVYPKYYIECEKEIVK